jgi:radical SAM superfamily enzyme YgiQ (UPF0313 family)
MSYQIVIFSDSSETVPENNQEYLQTIKLIKLVIRNAGPYRIATETRNLGFPTLVIPFLFHFNFDEIEQLCKKIIDCNTLIVGFSSTFWFYLDDNKKKILKFIVDFSRQHKNIRIVVGGTTNYSLQYLKPDYIFNGYSENEFKNYLLRITSNTLNHNFNFNLSQINYIPEDFLLNDEMVTIEIARGCIFQCKFCAWALNGKKKFDHIKNIETLKDEFIKNYEMFGITKYQFSDDTFNDSTYKLEFLEKIISSLPFKIKFSAYIRADLLYAHKEQISLLKEIGLSLAFFGIETFNKKSGNIIGKSMDGDRSKEFLYDLKYKYWKNDVKIQVALISGLPGETKKSHVETSNWILDQKYNLVDRIRISPLMLPNPLHNLYYYKSKFETEASKYGFYWPDIKSSKWKNYSNYVKSFDMAYELSRELEECSIRTDRDCYSTNYLLFHSCSKLSDRPISFEYLESLDRFDYKKWVTENSHTLSKLYIDNYKNKILNIN